MIAAAFCCGYIIKVERLNLQRIGRKAMKIIEIIAYSMEFAIFKIAVHF